MRSTCRADKKAVRQTISANSEPDLFWGMRGAGGNLGVAIEYTTHAFEIPDNVRITAPPCSAALTGIGVAMYWTVTDIATEPPSRRVWLPVRVKASSGSGWRGGACAFQTLLR